MLYARCLSIAEICCFMPTNSAVQENIDYFSFIALKEVIKTTYLKSIHGAYNCFPYLNLVGLEILIRKTKEEYFDGLRDGLIRINNG